jgi:hypothetical protein
LAASVGSTQASSDVVRLRAELPELRAQHAEQQLGARLLADRLDALLDRDRRQAAENEALRERNRLLAEEVAELRRRLDQNPRNWRNAYRYAAGCSVSS